MEEEGPPVPPKDAAYSARMELDRPPTAPSSGSKRKRSVHDQPYLIEHSESEHVDPDAHTPKRNNRSAIRQSDASASEDATPVQHKSIRRKKGMRNLSNLNLGHAAAKHAQSRESKFQEGSLTDKPSEKPPSVFTRVPRAESNNSLKVDDMMEDYHGDVNGPRYSIKPQPVAMEPYKKDDGRGFFQFGRQLAASFNPATLWHRWWSDTKDEPMPDADEAAEKARQKAEVEAKYQEMKKNGQFGFQTVRKRASHVPIMADTETPRDSGIEIDGLHNSRISSAASGMVLPFEDNYSGSDMRDAGSKQKTLKSRLHFKKPSLSNLKDDLKRVKSDFNLGATVRQRESSSSLSPVKQDYENLTLKKSQSRYDIKKQNKLTKRVSDLEVKLEQAKRELDEALVDASPVPNLTNKYPTFKHSGTFGKSKFIPGKLPSLPSERVLMAEQMKAIRGDAESESETEARKALDLNEMSGNDEMSDVDTVKASHGRPYPTRASALFNLDINNINNINTGVEETPIDDLLKHNQSLEVTEISPRADDNMDPNSIITDENAAKPIETEGYWTLDAKLKELDKNVKLANKTKQSKSKKRKATAEDKTFKPGSESNDDSEWEERTPRKKRKSAANDSSPKGRGSTKKTSPQGKKGKSNTTNAAPVTTSSPAKDLNAKQAEGTTTQAPTQAPTQTPTQAPTQGHTRDDELEPNEAGPEIDTEDRTLDVVYEEEEETSTIPINGETFRAPARFSRPALRSRSNSPHKRASSIEPGIEEQMMIRAATAAKKHPGRASRSISPPPLNGYSKTTTLEETVTIKPGENGVPKLPKGANGSFESLENLNEEAGVEVLTKKDSKSSFEWPEDVF